MGPGFFQFRRPKHRAICAIDRKLLSDLQEERLRRSAKLFTGPGFDAATRKSAHENASREKAARHLYSPYFEN
jgi:hypothetical protein